MLIYDPKDPHGIRDLLVVIVFVLAVGYMVLNAAIPNGDMIVAARVLQAASSVVVLYVYGPEAWSALTRPGPVRSDFLILGIWLSFLSVALHALWGLAYRLAGTPPWMLYMETVAPTALLSVVAAVLHVAIPGAVDGRVPRRNRMALGIMCGLGMLAIGVLLVARPDVAALVERTPTWLRDFWGTGTPSG